MYTVYWIRRKEHDNIFTQGYVGITNNLSRRLNEHVSNPNKMVSNALKGDVVVDIFGKDLTKDLALELESYLRPEDSIGWNICKGGNVPPISKKGHTKTEKYSGQFSEKTKKSYHKTGLAKWNGSDKQKKFLSEALKGRKCTWGNKISDHHKRDPFPKGNPMSNLESRQKVSKSKLGTRTLMKDGKRKKAKPGDDKWLRLVEIGWQPLSEFK